MARRFRWPVIVAALLVIPVIVLEEAEVREPWSTAATVANWLIWLTFLAELVAMLSVVPDRRAWLRQHPLEVAVVVLTPPFLPASLQAARVFRLLRLLRSCSPCGASRASSRPTACAPPPSWPGSASSSAQPPSRPSSASKTWACGKASTGR